ncbi:hypothetical protein SAMN05661012_04551 [Chitinophaga sancti]|uniref:Uncharacterized protein n=1 Tax=Chitinophaga sancti TaxID=1004 RepID=A0A1K1S1K8_9BACT|nr:hypothetical protein SAMN05661012_04551 [Chitinophaga sancti]
MAQYFNFLEEAIAQAKKDGTHGHWPSTPEEYAQRRKWVLSSLKNPYRHPAGELTPNSKVGLNSYRCRLPGAKPSE